MTRTTLFFTVSIPVTYDETKMTEEQALDAAQAVASEALDRSIAGRAIDTLGRHVDYEGPALVPPQAPTASQRREG